MAAGDPILSKESIDHVQSVVAQHGSDAWWTLSVEQLLPESLRHLAPTLKKVRSVVVTHAHTRHDELWCGYDRPFGPGLRQPRRQWN